MLAKERQDKIYAILATDGAVETSKLAERFSVSIETIRKDLLVMENANLLSRTHGGAVTKGRIKLSHALSERRQENSEEKRALSAKAMEFLSEGDVIFVDKGSTAIAFTQVLKECFTKMTVITQSCDVFEILRDHAEFRLILCGGFYNPKERIFTGAQTLDSIKNLRFEKAFIAPTAVSIKHGICNYGNETVLLQRQLVAVADQTYVLADSSKFEKTALLKMSDMDSRFYYITDGNLPKELKNLYAENGIKIYTATHE